MDLICGMLCSFLSSVTNTEFVIKEVAQIMLSGNLILLIRRSSIALFLIGSVILTISKFDSSFFMFVSSEDVIFGNDNNSISVIIEITNVMFDKTNPCFNA